MPYLLNFLSRPVVAVSMMMQVSCLLVGLDFDGFGGCIVVVCEIPSVVSGKLLILFVPIPFFLNGRC